MKKTMPKTKRKGEKPQIRDLMGTTIMVVGVVILGIGLKICGELGKKTLAEKLKDFF